jgi:hypothetical protein
MHGYVHEDEQPRGLYFLEWCDGEHPVDGAFLTIGHGDFGEDQLQRTGDEQVPV